MGKAKLPVDKVKKSKSKLKNIGSNTAAHPYVSNFNTIKVCNDNRKAIAKHCESENRQFKESRIASTIEDILKLTIESPLDFPENTEPNLNLEIKWIKYHCEFLLIKPGKEAGFWKAVKKELDSNDLSISNEIENKYKNKEGKFSPTALDAAMMHGLSVANPCINARRCNLVKYDDTNDSKKAAEKGKGCCPGQTGHHLLPSAMFTDCTPPYEESQAPTICAEGANNSNGSHGNIHRELRTILKDLKIRGKAVPYNSPIKMKVAIASGVASVNKAFPTSGCNPKCIKAQLDEYYKKDKLCEPNSHPGIEEIPDKVVVKVSK